MIWSRARFQHSFELFPRVFREVFPVLFPISLILWGLEFYVSWLNKARFDNPYDTSMTLIVLVGLLGIIFQSFATVIFLIYVAQSSRRQARNGIGTTPFQFLKQNFHQTFIEYIRSFISVAIYTLFFILPGVVRWVKLSVTCLVSCFDRDYLDGKKDALNESSRLVKGHFLAFAALLLFQSLLPMTIEEFAKGANTPIFLTGSLYLISWIFCLYFGIYFSLTFFALAGAKAETH